MSRTKTYVYIYIYYVYICLFTIAYIITNKQKDNHAYSLLGFVFVQNVGFYLQSSDCSFGACIVMVVVNFVVSQRITLKVFLCS